MRQKILAGMLIAVTASFLTSCISKEELDVFNHPIHMQGTFDPNLGLPVGSAELSIGDMISMFKQTEGFIEIGDDGVVAIIYDTTILTHTEINSSKDYDTADVYREVYSGALDIDLFNNIQNLPSEEDMRIQNLMLNLSTNVKANASAYTASLMTQYNVVATIDSIILYAVSNTGQHIPLEIANDSYTIPANQLAGSTGYDIDLIDNEDVSTIINSRPKQIVYSLRLNLIIPTSLFGLDIEEFVQQELQINSIDLNTSLGVRFPLSVYLNGLVYDIPLSVDLQNFDLGEDVSLEESRLILQMENNLPLDFTINADLTDANDVTLCPLIDNNANHISGAHLTQNTTLGTYVVDAPAVDTIGIALNANTLQALKEATHINVHSVVNTSTNGARGSKPVVSVSASDALSVKAYLQLHPVYHIDIPLTGESNNENK